MRAMRDLPSTRVACRALEISRTSFAVLPTSRVSGRRTRNGSDVFSATIDQGAGPGRGVGAGRAVALRNVEACMVALADNERAGGPGGGS
jgi:hypothetical protein